PTTSASPPPSSRARRRPPREATRPHPRRASALRVRRRRPHCRAARRPAHPRTATADARARRPSPRAYCTAVAHDDWRLRVELEGEGAHTLLSRLELVRDLEHDRLAVTRDGDTVFVYADSQAQLERALPVIDAELAAAGASARRVVREHWLDDEDRWDDDPREPSVEAETAA